MKEYNEPKMEIIVLGTEDIVSSSVVEGEWDKDGF